MVAQTDGVRSRRWDAVILGSGISALITAARLGMAGQRVLVVEEGNARALHPAIREPFFLAGARDHGMLDLCMRELMLSLIDRRRIEEEEISLQLVGRDLRADIGGAELTAEELVAWGICKPDIAHTLVRSLGEASEAERQAMLASPLVRLGRRVGLGRAGAEGSHRRGMPAEATGADPRLAELLAAQVRALSNLATAQPGPESQARLLGSVYKGGAGFSSGPPWLHGILRRRVEAVFGEFRTLSRKFRLVSVMDQPGIAVHGSSEIWVGRILVVGAPSSALANMLEPQDRPQFLKTERTTRRRLCVHLRTKSSILPEGMSKRVVLLNETSATGSPQGVATLSVFAREDDPKMVDLIVRSVATQSVDHAEQEQRLVDRTLALIPFHGDQVERVPVKQPVWDDDHLLEDPRRGACWPGELELRVTAKLPVYSLDRSFVAGLGLEGDLLLGLRAGELLQKELK